MCFGFHASELSAANYFSDIFINLKVMLVSVSAWTASAKCSVAKM
jgi:hypothetical protein